MPHAKSLFCLGSTGAGISYHTADQTSVRCRQRIMLIDGELSQRGDVDLVLVLLGNRVGELVIQAMNTLDDHNVIACKLHIVTTILSLLGLEVEDRKFDTLAMQEGGHILVEQLDVQTIDTLEVNLARLRVSRTLVTVQIIVIE